MTFPGVLLALALLLLVAKAGAEVAVRLGQPAVLGELIAGVLLGNAQVVGIPGVTSLVHDPSLGFLADLGVVLLLFSVGLQSTVRQMLSVGPTAAMVALLGVAASFALGWGAGRLIVPTAGAATHAFLGAILCSTSVGITTRVMEDLGRSRSAEARTILGAAVIDDVLGLVVLSSVSAVVRGGASISAAAPLAALGKAAAFLVGALALGALLSGPVFRLASKVRTQGVLLAAGLGLCLLLAWLSGFIGLAPIVGAFAAGLILEETHSRAFVERGEASLEAQVAPLVSFVAPVFFVLVGARTDLRAFVRPGTLLLTASLTAAAILGKLACALAVRRPADRVTVGIGMIPRGEIQLLYANALPDPAYFASVIVMVMVTALVTPLALGRRLRSAAAPR